MIAEHNLTCACSTFTDGVGQCSQHLADACAALLGHRTTPVSAAQIRSGGAKGVIAVVQDAILGDKEARLRPSMIKLQGGISMRVLNVIKAGGLPQCF